MDGNDKEIISQTRNKKKPTQINPQTPGRPTFSLKDNISHKLVFYTNCFFFVFFKDVCGSGGFFKQELKEEMEETQQKQEAGTDFNLDLCSLRTHPEHVNYKKYNI